MRYPLAAIAIACGVASPASAEKITAYWRLIPLKPTGIVSASFNEPFFQQRMVPARMVRLSEAALPAGEDDPVVEGTFLYEVVNASGKKGYCTLKDRSSGNQAKSLFIPALDKRPCFVDADGDGRFEGSFSVFEAYTQLSPPQPRGSIDAAKPMVRATSYEEVDPSLFPDRMTISYRLVPGKTLEKTRLRVTVDRPGHTESVERRGTTIRGHYALVALGTAAALDSIAGDRAEMHLVTLSPEIYVYADDKGTTALQRLPDVGVR